MPQRDLIFSLCFISFSILLNYFLFKLNPFFMIGDQYINKKLKGAAAQAAALAAADAKDTVGKLKKQGKLHYEKHIPNHTSLIRYNTLL